MTKSVNIPSTNELGYYEMRFESVGGLGANLAGQILAEALVMGHKHRHRRRLRHRAKGPSY